VLQAICRLLARSKCFRPEREWPGGDYTSSNAYQPSLPADSKNYCHIVGNGRLSLREYVETNFQPRKSKSKRETLVPNVPTGAE
jgi:hypothetical protein